MDNDSSLRFSIKAARENVRTTRDVLPEDIWEHVNELYLFVEEQAEQAIARKNRFQFLDQIVKRNQQIHGIIESTVCRDHGYTFLKVGRLLEHSDIISRVIDVDAAAITEREGAVISESSLFWGNLLSALSANSAYRSEIGSLIDSNDVINFLFKSRIYPRSVYFCMSEIEHMIKGLKSSERAVREINSIVKLIDGLNAENMKHKQLHEFIDVLQARLNKVHTIIYKSWFGLTEPAPSAVNQ